jgi:hypothetical protein
MKNINKSASLLTVLACAALSVPAMAGTVTRSVTTNADGSVTHSKTVVTNGAVAPAVVPVTPGVQTTTTRTTKTEQWSAVAPASGTTTTTTTTTNTTNTPWYAPTVGVTYIYGNDDSQILRSDRRVGNTYAGAVDRQGNNSLRYENKTFDGYNN